MGTGADALLWFITVKLSPTRWSASTITLVRTGESELVCGHGVHSDGSERYND